MITFTYDKKSVVTDEKISLGNYVKSIGMEKSVLSCKVNNVIRDKDYIINESDIIEPITIENDEGYLIYKETLIIVLLHAAEQIEGCSAVFVRQSVNKSNYFEIEAEGENKEHIADKIKEKMREIIEEDTPMMQIEVKKKAAAEIFASCNEYERAKEIALLPVEEIKLCKTARRYHIMYQPLAYSLRSVEKFEVRVYDDGFLLKYPTNYTATQIPEIKLGEKVHRAIEDYRDWITTIGAADIFSLNKYIRENRGTELINLSEGLHEKRISSIADKIKENPDIKIILIAGPSASGKTTFANRLCLHLKINHIDPIVISLDDYYVDDERMPRDEKGEMDFECVESIDYMLFNEHLSRLANGESVDIPIYDFNIRKRVSGKTISLKEGQIIIAEGIHALNELLTSKVERKNKYKIYLSALTSLCLDEYNAFSPTDNRLLRRMVRDASYRNTSAEGTFKLWSSVRRGEKEYIFPFESEADQVFNSSLVYELSVLKKPAMELLMNIDKKSEYYSRARRLIQLLSYFEQMEPSAIPPTSIIREFIGGSTIVH